MSETSTIAQALGKFGAEATFDRLPREVAQSVEQRILDSIGIQIAANAQKLGDGVRALIEVWGGKPEAGLVGSRDRVPAPSAALFNGTLAHSLDFDDTHLPSVLHPSATIVPAVLALAEAVGASGREAIAAAAVGIEITVRTGMGGYLADEGNVFFEKGWHATSICGTLGAAAAGAKLLGLGAQGITDALGIAASFGGGVIEANRAGGTVKQLHCGWAAHAGLTAALLVEHGYTGPPTIFEGRFGFYQALLDGHYDPHAVLDRLGERWELPGIFFKPYPANHYTHAGIDAALALRRQHRIDVDAIERIDLGAAAAPLRTIGEPREEKIHPHSGYHAQFSGPFTVATALVGGGGLGVYFDDFTDEKAKDPKLLALAAKVQTFVDDECDRIFPNQFPAVVRITLQDGTVFEERVMQNRGGSDNPLSVDELKLKFRLNAGQALAEEQVERLAQTIGGLDEARDAGEVVGLTR